MPWFLLPSIEPLRCSSRSIHRCANCTGNLLAADFLNVAARKLDEALMHHTSKECTLVVTENERLLSTAVAQVESGEANASDVLTTLLWVEDEPPLTFCARHGLNDLGQRLIAANLFTLQSLVHVGLCGLSALHVGASSDAKLPLCHALLRAGADPSSRSQDGPSSGDVGGRTPLHVAAALGATVAARALLAAWPQAARATDYDGCIPARAAWLQGHYDLAYELATAASAVLKLNETTIASRGSAEDEELLEADDLALVVREVREMACTRADASLERSLCEMARNERERTALCIAERPRLRTIHIMHGAVGSEECEWLLGEVRAAAAHHGWQGGRHRHYATEDLPIWRAPLAAAWVRRRFCCAWRAQIAAAYGICDDASLVLQEAFAVRYEPHGQPSLSMHRDSTMFSFNILLNEAADFEGGGTCFAEPALLLEWPNAGRGLLHADDPTLAPSRNAAGAPGEGEAPTVGEARLVQGQRGDCVVHCGQLLHGAASVTSGTRFVLVCFVAERPSRHQGQGQ
jgi:hypothetical protein